MNAIKNKIIKAPSKSSVVLLFLAAVIFLIGDSNAANTTVTAALSRNRVAAGEVVQLDVKVTGAQQADVPQEIPAEGLQIKLAGESSQMQMVNFSVTSSVLYSYIVIPLKAGTLTVPSINVRAEGKYFKTSPQQLTVIAGASAAIPPASASTAPPNRYTPPSTASSIRNKKQVDLDRLGFAELIIPKKKFYVGEVVPVEIRFYVDAHYDFSTMGPPTFGGEGILTERFKDPQQDRVERDGFLYNTATYHTLLSAIKPGTLDIDPAILHAVVAIPESTPAGMDADLFSRLLGGRSPFMREHQLSLKTEPLHCEVLPLPQEGRPNGFSGAVGEFHLTAAVTPHQIVEGDPVTLTLTLSGKGNFQGLKAPLLTEKKGWRTYPPSEHFESTDPSGWKGAKTFETTMIAQDKVVGTPSSLFSYFDPVTASYVTLTTPSLPIQIEASAAVLPAATPAIAKDAAPTTVSSSKTTMAASLPEGAMHSWKDPLHRKEFIIAWGALFLAALILACYLGIKQYERGHHLTRYHEEQQMKTWISEMQDKNIEGSLFYNKAASCAEILLKRDPSQAEELQEIFQKRDEINYGAREVFLRDSERERFLKKLTFKKECA